MAEKKLLQGLSVSAGVVTGRPRVVARPEDACLVEEGDIVVLPNSHPQYAIGVMNAAGVVCEEGGRLSHVCIVSLEMGIPCVTQAPGAMEQLASVKRIRLDGDEGAVYDVSE